ncbi:MAG TPA: hypothetical protein DCS83_02720 [Prevotella sp.]|jgi:hypothetical protein|nr:hypothetical protein [Prevotella sp.]
MINVVDLVNRCYDRLPADVQGHPWDATGHGRNVLQTEEQLDAYLAAYGEAHIIKCRAAFQNFPFNDVGSYDFEIYDWGCGQGIASLTLIEMLCEHNLLSRLCKITLIEPSHIALERAKRWVGTYASSGVEVQSVERKIPNTKDDKWNDIDCKTSISINIFSNILDIWDISLSWLAHKVASLANINYVICVGPKFTHNSRLADFCGYFNPSKYFSNINSFSYSYTTRTNHSFGCEARGFVYKRSEVLDESYKEKTRKNICDSDDDFSTIYLRGVLNDALLNLYNQIRQHCSKSFENIFLRPQIGVDLPDIVLASISHGIVLLDICNKAEDIEVQLRRVKGIKEELYNTYLKSLKVATITVPAAFYCVQPILYFPTMDKNAVKRLKDDTDEHLCNKSSKQGSCQNLFKNVILVGNDEDISSMLCQIRNRAFRYDYYEELISLIKGRWHSYKDGDHNFRLTKRQKELVGSPQSRLRIKGVAGCGKTQVMANRAVKRQLETGSSVLILTFNITLIQYIRMRINQVPADFPTNKFIITNYHQFFTAMAREFVGRIPFNAFDNDNFFEPYKDQTRRFRTIIIDEVQDYKTEWLSLLIKYFLSEDGSITVFGDGEQNIYEREMEKGTKMPRIPSFIGAWKQMSERISMRILNPQIAVLSSAFARNFLSLEMSTIAIENRLNFESYYVKYWNIGENFSAEKIARNIPRILEHYKISIKDVAVLASSINILRDVDFQYRQLTHLGTMVSFETQEELGEVKKNSTAYVAANLEAIRHVAKTHFTTDCDCLKLSTIHSFKGWEAKTIILLLQKEVKQNQPCNGDCIQERENSAALLYTALTRAQCNLFIINVGNTQYDTFFQKNIK